MNNLFRFGSVLAALAVLALAPRAMANSGGPQPGSAGVTGERTCNQANCHTGTDVNAGGGKVEITFPGALTYTPGQAQTLTVRITDSAARVYGFQVTARLSSNVKTQAGDLVSPDGKTFVHCSASFTISSLGSVIFSASFPRPIERKKHDW